MKEKNATPKKYKKWTDADEAKLIKLVSDDVALDDTEFGRQRAQLKGQKKQELMAFAKHNHEEAAQILVLMSMVGSNLNADSDLDATHALVVKMSSRKPKAIQRILF